MREGCDEKCKDQCKGLSVGAEGDWTIPQRDYCVQYFVSTQAGRQAAYQFSAAIIDLVAMPYSLQ